MIELGDIVSKNVKNGITQVKTEEEWETYKVKNDIIDDSKKDNFIKYGTIYGTKYCVKTQYGDWDKDFTMETMDKFVEQYYNKLVKGGTIIIFFDLWKITSLKEILENIISNRYGLSNGSKQILNHLIQTLNYLTNRREIALTAVKGGKPTFNSKYDKGIYEYPLQGGKERFHPTQKQTSFEELIKHLNEGDGDGYILRFRNHCYCSKKYK